MLKPMDFFMTMLLATQLAGANPKVSDLPVLMQSKSGAPIAAASDWVERKEFIRYQLQDLVYGFLPAKDKNPKMNIKVVSETPIIGGAGIYRDVRLQFPSLKKEIKLAVFISAKSTATSHVFLVINKCGNQTTTFEPSVVASGTEWAHSPHCYKDGQVFPAGYENTQYPVMDVLGRGDNFITFAESEIAADSPRQPSVGLKGAMPPTSLNPKKNWGVLMAWAWGFMRAVDYIETAKDLNSKRVIAVGHSRRGKAALLAAAYDERISAVIPHQSGTGGTALMRGSGLRETPHMITNGWIGYPLMGEPDGLTHWFASGFNEISEDVDRLPFDSHFLISLVAPRALLDFQARDDFWAGQDSAAIALAAAKPAWILLSGNSANLQQHFVPGGHELNRDHWKVFVDFANDRFPR